MATETNADESRTQEYKKVALVAKGKEGSDIYKAVVLRTGEFVALKVTPTTRIKKPDNIEEPVNLKPLMEEIEYLKACAQCEYCLDFHEFFKLDKSLWMVMEYCLGGSMKKMIRNAKLTFDEKCIQVVASSLLQALEFMHSLRIVHRDVKADNIFVTIEGVVKLADFGVSAQLTDEFPVRRTIMGTPLWMAPEVLKETTYNETIDIWSLGITCIELAEGEPPLTRVPIMKAVFMIPQSPSPKLEERSKWSQSFHGFLASCLEKDPFERESASELLEHDFVATTTEELNSETPRGKSEPLRVIVEENLAKLETFFTQIDE